MSHYSRKYTPFTGPSPSPATKKKKHLFKNPKSQMKKSVYILEMNRNAPLFVIISDFTCAKCLCRCLEPNYEAGNIRSHRWTAEISPTFRLSVTLALRNRSRCPVDAVPSRRCPPRNSVKLVQRWNHQMFDHVISCEKYRKTNICFIFFVQTNQAFMLAFHPFFCFCFSE